MNERDAPSFDLLAGADGRLDAAGGRRLAEALGGRPELAAALQQDAELTAELRRRFSPVLAEPVPPRLLLALDRGLQGAVRPRRLRAVAAAAGVAAFAALVAMLAVHDFAAEREATALPAGEPALQIAAPDTPPPRPL